MPNTIKYSKPRIMAILLKNQPFSVKFRDLPFKSRHY